MRAEQLIDAALAHPHQSVLIEAKMTILELRQQETILSNLLFRAFNDDGFENLTQETKALITNEINKRSAMHNSFLETEAFKKRYIKACWWRDAWLQLSNKSEPGGRLETKHMKIIRKAEDANSRIANLMKQFDLLQGKK